MDLATMNFSTIIHAVDFVCKVLPAEQWLNLEISPSSCGLVHPVRGLVNFTKSDKKYDADKF